VNGSVDDLRWLFVEHYESSAQRLMAPHDFVEAAAQGCHIELAYDAQSSGDIVSRGAGFELIEKPQALLREREWHRFVMSSRRDGIGLVSTIDALFLEQILEQLKLVSFQSRVAEVSRLTHRDCFFPL